MRGAPGGGRPGDGKRGAVLGEIGQKGGRVREEKRVAAEGGGMGTRRVSERGKGGGHMQCEKEEEKVRGDRKGNKKRKNKKKRKKKACQRGVGCVYVCV